MPTKAMSYGAAFDFKEHIRALCDLRAINVSVDLFLVQSPNDWGVIISTDVAHLRITRRTSTIDSEEALLGACLLVQNL